MRDRLLTGRKRSYFCSCKGMAATALGPCLLVALAVFHVGLSGDADGWRRRVIYQILTDRFSPTSGGSTSCSDLSTYCGGTLRGITNRLDYIQGLGMNAIWISPIPVNTPHGYHGYWAMDITKLNPHFGTESDLQQLVQECHRRGIWVMLDIVANHMGVQRYGDWNNFTFFTPFNLSQHYHPYCQIKDWDDQNQVEVCRLANLPDLDQSNSFVRSTLKSWVATVVKNYSFDGLRCDTTPEVPKDFWSEYRTASGTFTIGEVFNGDPKYVSGYQGALDATLNYPMYYKLQAAFQQRKSMRNIHDGVNAEDSLFPDVTVLGMFLDNHDNPRFLNSQKDYALLYNGLAYILFSQGVPIVYYGTEQGYSGGNDPNNRESLWPNFNANHPIYKFVSGLTHFRNGLDDSFYSSKQVERYVDDQFFAYTRGQVFVATSNIGSGNSITVPITYHPYSIGTVLVNQLNKSDVVKVGEKGFQVTITNGMPKVYYPATSAGMLAGRTSAVLVNQLNKSDVVKVGEKGFQVTVTNGMPKVYYPATSAGMLAGRTSAGPGESVWTVTVLSTVGLTVGLSVTVAIAVLVLWSRRKRTLYTELK